MALYYRRNTIRLPTGSPFEEQAPPGRNNSLVNIAMAREIHVHVGLHKLGHIHSQGNYVSNRHRMYMYYTHT